MRRNKSLLLRMIPWIIMIAAIAALIVFVGIPLYGQQETETENPPVISYYDGEEKPLIMENDHLFFEMDAKTTWFSVTEKDTGRIWKSTPENAESDPIAQTSNRDTLLSTLLITYTNSGGEVTMNNFAYGRTFYSMRKIWKK